MQQIVQQIKLGKIEGISVSRKVGFTAAFRKLGSIATFLIVGNMFTRPIELSIIFKSHQKTCIRSLIHTNTLLNQISFGLSFVFVLCLFNLLLLIRVKFILTDNLSNPQ